jgi:hypothetical protein
LNFHNFLIYISITEWLLHLKGSSEKPIILYLIWLSCFSLIIAIKAYFPLESILLYEINFFHIHIRVGELRNRSFVSTRYRRKLLTSQTSLPINNSALIFQSEKCHNNNYLCFQSFNFYDTRHEFGFLVLCLKISFVMNACYPWT